MTMLKESELKAIQNRINYKFKNTKLLQQAFTRKSYAAAHGNGNNEVLEFYGDRILDFAVVKDFYNKFGRINNKKEFVSSKSVGKLCQIDIELVKNAHLAEQITELGFTKYIQVQNQKERTAYKNIADLFEAILGAVAIDSGWNIKTIENVYTSMMTIQNPENKKQEEVDYIDVFTHAIWKYQICKTENKYTKLEHGVVCHAIMLIDGKTCEIQGCGKDEHTAKLDISEQGYKLLQLLYEKKLAEDESYTDQLYTLFKYGFIGEPEFKFEYYPANSKYPEDFWRCTGTHYDTDLEFQAEGTDLDDAREQVCYAILCDFLNLQVNNIGFDEIIEDTNSAVPIRGEGLLKLVMSMKSNLKSIVA